MMNNYWRKRSSVAGGAGAARDGMRATFQISGQAVLHNSFEQFCRLPASALLPMIRDARQRTVAFGSYISGLANTGGKNNMNLTLDDISVRSGEIDGFFHFFINWHRKELLPTRGDA